VVSCTGTELTTAGLLPELFDGVMLLSSPQLMTMVDATRATAVTSNRSMRIVAVPSLLSHDHYPSDDESSSQARRAQKHLGIEDSVLRLGDFVET
jgi:hypothetical protein